MNTPPQIMGAMKTNMESVWHPTCMGEMKNAYQLSTRKPEREWPT
jgi:hypothetical protein